MTAGRGGNREELIGQADGLQVSFWVQDQDAPAASSWAPLPATAGSKQTCEGKERNKGEGRAPSAAAVPCT